MASAAAKQEQQRDLYASPVDKALKTYDTDANSGLNSTEAQSRLNEHGLNQLRESEERGVRDILIAQFQDVVIWLLSIAAVAAFAFQDWIEGIAILIAIAVNAGIGFLMEWRAVKSMEALHELAEVEATVRRDGEIKSISAEAIVPGDVLVLDAGNVVAADVRLTDVSELKVDESALTGESVPVEKRTDAVDEDTELADRTNMAYKGTVVSGGGGEGIVTATGMDTELGHISEMVEQAGDDETPLEERLDALGQRLAWLTIAVAIVIGVAGYFSGRELRLMVETTVALAVAAIPEGLPIVATVALARGMKRMADHNALVEKLETVETLGAVNVLFTDKTGTLTENEMTVDRIATQPDDIHVEFANDSVTFTVDDNETTPDEHPILAQAVKVGVLCNEAEVANDHTTGEPLEVALLKMGQAIAWTRDKLEQDLPRERLVAFSRDTTMMATFHKQNSDYYVAVKGAPEAVLEASTQIKTGENEMENLSDEDRDHWRERNSELAGNGLRMIALAEKTASSQDTEPYEDLTFLGLVGLMDPPRGDIANTLKEAAGAGIRVIMVTGDQPETARNIGNEVNLIEDASSPVLRGKEIEANGHHPDDVLNAEIFARITPEQKLSLIEVHQDNGARVAMTGDGVNDAPALKQADIGIAMGERGTQVAQEAADMVLQDDRLETILVAIQQGRIIFGNIRKFIIFLLSSNLGQIMIVGIAALFTPLLPINPLQILFLNAVVDVFPALALGLGEGSHRVMERDPRKPDEPVLMREHWTAITLYSALIAAAVLSMFVYALRGLGLSGAEATTLSYLTLALARTWNVFNTRDNDAPIFNNEVTRNKYVWGAIAISVALILSTVFIPGFNTVLEVTTPTMQQWLIIIGTSLAPLVVAQIGKSIIGSRRSE